MVAMWRWLPSRGLANSAAFASVKYAAIMRVGEALCFTILRSTFLLAGVQCHAVEFTEHMRGLVLSADGGDLVDGDRVLGVATSGVC